MESTNSQSQPVVAASAREEAGDHAARARANQKERRANLCDAYDYIIVGGGSAGCVLANRISARGASVLLIEAGTDQIHQPKIEDPLRWPENTRNSDTFFVRTTTPQPHMAARSLFAGSGKVWGGSGSVNAMIVLRGDIHDYLRWQHLVGHTWSAHALSECYLRTERYVPGDRPGRGKHGPLSVSRYAENYPLTQAYIAGAAELGLAKVDQNAGKHVEGIGVVEAHVTSDNQRSGPAQDYLVPALTRPNLTVLSNTTVTGLELNGCKAEAVKLVLDGAPRTFRAEREIILCAGALESPKLLLLSGIGRSDQLQPFNIPVKHELLRIGENLHDHILVYNVLLKARKTLPPAVSNSVSAIAFSRSSAAHHTPDIEIMCGTLPFFNNTLPSGEGFSLIPLGVRLKSRGFAGLKSADPTQPMLIDPRCLSVQSDVELMVEVLDQTLALANSKALSAFASEVVSPGKLATREDKVRFIAENAGTGFHQVGTCSAGRDAEESVVDPHFRVWGIDNLRVVDASVIPEVPIVNIHAPVLALAELAAEVMGFAPHHDHC